MMQLPPWCRAAHVWHTWQGLIRQIEGRAGSKAPGPFEPEKIEPEKIGSSTSGTIKDDRGEYFL